MDITKKVTEILQDTFAPDSLLVENNSADHVGHAGASQGGAHLAVSIVSQAFFGKSMIERHRLIYQALGSLMKQEIHALSIKAGHPKNN
ncbi:MAG: BolA family protein [Methylacidiphilales bacterium]|nr:BolA family protein [Candidatus Methylacidiphilales bacterium]